MENLLWTLFWAILWVTAIAGHLLLLRILLAPGERAKLGLPLGTGYATWLLLSSLTIVNLLVDLLLLQPLIFADIIFFRWYFEDFTCDLGTGARNVLLSLLDYTILALLMLLYELALRMRRSHPHKTYAFVGRGLAFLGGLWVMVLTFAVPFHLSDKVIAKEKIFY